MKKLSDITLIQHYLATQNQHAFAQLYNRHRQRVYNHCLLLCCDPDEAEDFTQEIFIRLTDKLATFQGQAAFTSWLQVVTTNYCRDQFRKLHKRQLAHQHYQHYLTQPNHQVEEEHTFQLMERVIEQLPPHQRELLLLKYEDQVAIKAIAQQQNTTLSAIKMRIKRARDQARSQYTRLSAKVV